MYAGSNYLYAAATQSFKRHSETLLPPSIRTMKHTLEVEAFDDELVLMMTGGQWEKCR